MWAGPSATQKGSRRTAIAACGLAGSLPMLPQPHRGPVRQDLGDPLRELGGVVAHGDDGVGPALLGVLDHAGERLGAGLLADLLVGADVAPQDAGEGPPDPLRDRLGTHHDAAHHAEVLGDLITLEIVGRRDGDLVAGHDWVPCGVASSPALCTSPPGRWPCRPAQRILAGASPPEGLPMLDRRTLLAGL